MRQNHTQQRLGLLPVAAALIAMATWLALAASVQAASNSVRIEPATVAVAQGETVTVSLVVEAPEAGLDQWDIDVKFDKSVLTPLACVSHIEDPDVGCAIDFAPDTVRASGIPSTTILPGPVTLAEITFRAAGAAAGCYWLDVTVPLFFDTDDVETYPTVDGGEICIIAGPTPTPTESPTPTPSPEPTPVPTPEGPPCARYTDFDPENFSNPTKIGNHWFPLVPGRKLVFEGVAEGEHRRVVFTATDLTKVINGVRTVVLWDRDYMAGVLKEAELAFFAQDDDGNVWSLGEYPEEYENGQFAGAPSVWIPGQAGAEGGIHMPADPQVGSPPYLQGWAPDIDFLDCAQVVDRLDGVCVPVQCYNDILVTEEESPLAIGSGHQRKFHVSGVGIVEITAVEDPEGETLGLKKYYSQISEGELEWARQGALKLEERAYQISDVYRATARAESPAGTPTPTPVPTPLLPVAPTPIALSAISPAQPGPSALPFGGGGGPLSVWMVPSGGLALALLALSSRGYLRWAAQSRIERAWDRRQTLKPEQLVYPVSRVDREPPPAKRQRRHD